MSKMGRFCTILDFDSQFFFRSQTYLTDSTISFSCESRDIERYVGLRKKRILFSSNFNKNR